MSTDERIFIALIMIIRPKVDSEWAWKVVGQALRRLLFR